MTAEISFFESAQNRSHYQLEPKIIARLFKKGLRFALKRENQLGLTLKGRLQVS